MRPLHAFTVGEEQNALGLKEEEGWTGAFTRAQAKGAMPNGTRVRKLAGDPGDTHPICSPGVVLGSFATPPGMRLPTDMRQIDIFYFIEWDAHPKHAVGTPDWKITDGTPQPPYRAKFDPNNETLIRSVWAARRIGPDAMTSYNRHVFLAIAQAVRCFHWRLFDLFPNGLPINEETGEMMLQVAEPATFFDDFCMKLVIEDLCNATGKGLARMRFPNPERKGTPDVIFV